MYNRVGFSNVPISGSCNELAGIEDENKLHCYKGYWRYPEHVRIQRVYDYKKQHAENYEDNEKENLSFKKQSVERFFMLSDGFGNYLFAFSPSKVKRCFSSVFLEYLHCNNNILFCLFHCRGGYWFSNRSQRHFYRRRASDFDFKEG